MLNKMPKAKDAVTGLVRRRGLLLLPVLVLLLAGAFYFYQSSACKDAVRISGECIVLEKVSSPQERAKGLSDRESMPKNHGMLFDFVQPGTRCMWMKDMRFSLDMIWLNKENRIVKIEENVSPNTYPHAFCAPGAKYVIELNQGQAERLGLDIGEHVNL
jgi:uncharacterized protein